ncbi:MAG TPA: hypothetical protein VLA12_17220 [Planctomycetaceae bacterium]|nr:hypothetical protein [Planctomycetaceae bacterium]
MIDSLYRNKPLVLGCLCLFWGVTLIETLPQTTLVHTAIEKRIDPVLTRLGLWQGKWDLFAPGIDHFNARMEAHITWEDGTQSVWKVPDWFEHPGWRKFVDFRHMEYYDTMHNAPDKLVWRDFASYLARQESAKANKQVRMVELYAEGDFIDKPSVSWRPAYSRPLFTERSRFHTWYPYAHTDSQSLYFGN